MSQEQSKELSVLEELRKFMESRVVFTAVELGIFDLIDQRK
ncbi:MAG: methyltransferase family protein, partial [Thermodesulforhabdaceae bacterium]